MLSPHDGGWYHSGLKEPWPWAIYPLADMSLPLPWELTSWPLLGCYLLGTLSLPRSWVFLNPISAEATVQSRTLLKAVVESHLRLELESEIALGRPSLGLGPLPLSDH